MFSEKFIARKMSRILSGIKETNNPIFIIIQTNNGEEKLLFKDKGTGLTSIEVVPDKIIHLKNILSEAFNAEFVSLIAETFETGAFKFRLVYRNEKGEHIMEKNIEHGRK